LAGDAGDVFPRIDREHEGRRRQHDRPQGVPHRPSLAFEHPCDQGALSLPLAPGAPTTRSSTIWPGATWAPSHTSDRTSTAPAPGERCRRRRAATYPSRLRRDMIAESGRATTRTANEREIKGIACS